MELRGRLRSVSLFVAVIVSQFGATFTFKEDREISVTPGPGGGGPIFQLESALAEAEEAQALEAEIHPVRHHHDRKKNETKRWRRQHHHALEAYLQSEAREANFFNRRPQRRHLADHLPGRFYVVGSESTDGSGDSGPWGPWSEPSECSRSCGGGIAFQSRSCSESEPHGTSKCVGGLKRYFSCNIQDCPDVSRDFRSEQCAQFDDVQFEGRYYKWIPYTKAPNRCELNCMPRGERFYYRHKRKVIDGTRCDDEKLDICVDGECLPVGCDMILGSEAKEDQCRECGGDGSGCNTVKGLLRMNDLVVGYNDILLIPAGATNILVRELEASNNYLAIRNTTNHYYLNGNWRIDFPRDLRFAGTVFHYERRPHGFYAPESIKALGPTLEAIYIVLLYQETNRGVQYEYSIPKGVTHQTDPDSYSWVAGEFSECSASCGGGMQTRPVICARRRDQEAVPDDLCDPGSRLPSNNTCGEDHCPPQWAVQEWSQCSQTCGGENMTGGIRTRKVYCEQIVQGGVEAVVDDSLCLDGVGPAPPDTEPCNEDIVCPVWHIGPWKPCDRLCGEGKHKRRVICYHKIIDEETGKEVIEVLNDDACPGERPIDTKTCIRRPCEGVDWIVSEWSGCENKCGLEKETRQAFCSSLSGKIYPSERCHRYRMPVLERECKNLAPCEYNWYTSQWSECSAACGKGVKTRSVFCGFVKGITLTIVEDEKCDAGKKFEKEEECIGKGGEECKGQWFAGPWSKCSKECGGGDMKRKVLCIADGKTVSTLECDPSLIAFTSETCNNHPCSDDQIMPMEPTHVVDEEEECEEEDGTYETLETTLGLGATGTGLSTSGITDDQSRSTLPESTVTATTGATETLTTGTEETEITMTEGTTTEGTTTEGTTTEGTTVTEGTATTVLVTAGSDTTESTETEPTTTPVTMTTITEGTESTTIVPTRETTTAATTESATTESIATSTTEEETTVTEISESTEGTSEGTTEDITEGTTATEMSSTSATETTMTEETEMTLTTETDSFSTPTTPTTMTESTGTETTGTETTDVESSTEAATTEESTPSEDTTVTDMTDTTTTEAEDETVTTETTEEAGSTVTQDMTTSESSESTKGSEESTEMPSSTVTPKEEEDYISSFVEPEDLGSGTGPVDGEEEYDEDTLPLSSYQSDAPYSPTAEMRTTGTGDMKEETSLTSHGPTDEMLTTGTGDMKEETSLTSHGPTDEMFTTGTGDMKEETSLTSHGPTDEMLTTGTGDLTEQTASTSYSSKSSIMDAITKEQKVRKCKRKKKPARETDLVKTCKESEFGCCNDGVTAAKGPFSKGCPQPETCEDTKFGCCASDGVTPAEGPGELGCPPTQCNETLFGCCPDGISSAEGNNFEGCKEEEIVPYYCKETEFGCCPDGLTAATGPNNAGCFVCEGSGECEKCSDTKYGCCPDNIRAAFGPDFAGCEDLEEGSGDEPPISTTEGEDCHITPHGCCPDGKKVAEGPYFSGCGVINEENCTASYFGCCPDRVTAALGPEYHECPMPCKTEKYGCCDDNITPAHGPNQEGCCLNTAYGCCPDNVLAAQGLHLEGCGCQYSTYGCCPDNETAARGPDKEGCGCQHTTHSCCPDMYTPASGPNYGGCPCHTYQFGCCADGVTVARGPHRQGCGCENTEFKCCSDQKTPRSGPDDECGCEASKFGCCPDGETPAEGDKFEGCIDVPIRPGEMCTLAKDRGPCREFSVKWFFDMEYGGCSRFWYGGCHGNENRFKSQDDCKGTCVEPKGRDACFLPKVEGPCDGYYPTWYYEPERKQCGQFIYGGCLGNNNKFQTREECEELCVIPDNIDACDQPKVEGPCRGNYSRWYYDQDNRMCNLFTYGGCKGNDNNFHTERACHQQCLQPGRTREMCALPRAKGNCTERLPRWFFDGSENRCMPFYYSGCEGNANRFETQSECEETCPPKIELDTCMMPALVGECRNYTAKWYYDSYELRCRQFYFGGCGGNQNNFATLDDCQYRCASGYSTEAPVQEFLTEYCFYPEDSGPCSHSSEKWFYDRRDGICKSFNYGGCQGNQNRFNSRYECESHCTNSQDICSLPRVVGPCSGTFQQWFYDQQTDSCHPFDYGGCQGNHNRFNDRASCEQRCQRARPTEPAPLITHVPVTQGPPGDFGTDICNMPMDAGQCLENLNNPDDDSVITSWFYDYNSGRCQAFSFSGCGGNANRFGTEEQCERQCGEFRNQDVCSEPQSTGPCRGRFIKWYYNKLTGLCLQFIYGGCSGNGNRFSSAAECESVCSHQEELLPPGNGTSVSHQAVCRQHVDRGPCRGSYKQWYFDDSRRSCVAFIYGGCGGNQNRFRNYETCRRFCSVLLGENEIGVDERPEKPDCFEIRERCNLLQCPYGVERSVDEKDCETCRCHNPCEDHVCEIPGTVCTVDLHYPPDSDEAQFRAVCVSASKPGQCPTLSSESSNCQTECHSDADCNGPAKCCRSGCRQLCLFPVSDIEFTTEEPKYVDFTTAGYEDSPRILQSDTEVSAEEGSYATLKCIAVGRPAPTVLWRKNLDIIDGTEGRHRLLSDGSLQIIALTRNDAGIYTCFASNGVGNPVKQDYRLVVTAPQVRAAEVVGDETTYVVVTLSVPTTLHCRAIGWPRPSVTWWRGERMLPLSSKRYEQRRDMTLLLRSVGLQDLGPYTCQAYNGIGKAASWTVTLQAVGPVAGLSPDSPYAQFLITPPERIGGTRTPQPRPTPPTIPARLPEVTPPPAPPTHGGIVPVKANITLFRTTYPVSSDLSIPCQVEGYPIPRVIWYKDETRLESSERVQLADPNQVIILRANTSDTGTYRCEASNPYGVSSSSISILVEGMYVHPNCTDNPFFANCLLIVKAHYCTHKYYARFCCRSCTLAGQLPSHGPHLDGQSLSFGSGLRRYNKRK